jgi:hypothetical protein
VLGFQPVDRNGDVGAPNLPLTVERELEKILGMAQPGECLVFARRQPVAGELSNRFEHGEAERAVWLLHRLDQMVIYQRRHSVENVEAQIVAFDGFRCFESPPTGQDSEAAKKRLLDRAQQVIAPRDRVTQSTLPNRGVMISGGQ